MSKPSEKILLVDDEPRLLSGLRRNLSADFSVVVAESGDAALDAIANDDSIAVVVSDMQMPGMNGVELLKEVRGRAPHIRRMMLTGNSDQETAVAAVNEGAVMRFMRKPCGPDMMKEAINYALEDFRFSSADTTTIDTSNARVARDSFLAMMNHEIRTPLNHIIGLSQLISLPETVEYEPSRNFLDTMMESADDLSHTLLRVLDYTRINSGDTADVGQTFSLADVIDDEVDAARDAGAARKITVGFDNLHDDLAVTGSRDDIGMAIRELLSNAVKFNVDGGHVGLTLRELDGRVMVKISDTGQGMSADDIQQITGAFRQGDESATREHGGIGLGINLASLIAEKNGGSLSISSDERSGTTVILSFERTVVEEETDAEEMDEASDDVAA
ncbi:MAG: hybrid sensor histidine kinase/response regulator [Pseudomonadota bacterium]